MSNIDINLLRQQLDRIAATLPEGNGDERVRRREPPGSPPPSDGSGDWRATVDTRLARVDGALEGLKASIDGTRWIVGLVAAILMGGFAFLGFQLNRVESAVSVLPTKLSDEFHAMRSEISAQVSAIANAITATRQAQPAPPQILVVPPPNPSAPGKP